MKKRPCPVCGHPELSAIDAAVREQGVRPAARRWPELKIGQIWRHSQGSCSTEVPAEPATVGVEPVPVGPPALPPRPLAVVAEARDDDATSPRKIVTALVERRCVELRAAGKSYVSIAAELGVDVDTAEDTVERVLLRTVRGTNARADLARRLDVERIDKLLAGIWDRATTAPEGTDELPPDYASQDRAVERTTKLLERRARLLGLDAPTVAITLEHPKVREELDRAFRELLGVVSAALKPYPEASRAVVAAMRAWRAAPVEVEA